MIEQRSIEAMVRRHEAFYQGLFAHGNSPAGAAP